MRFLSTAEWYAWEREVYARLYGVDISLSALERHLVFPEASGKVLAKILCSPDFSVEQQLKAVKLALKALKELHLVTIRWFDDTRKRLSHGDATADNVICDVKMGSAVWIDFDMVHNMNMCPEWRFADDLRAFIYSTAAYSNDEILEVVVQTILHEYADRDVLCQFGELVKQRRYRPITYHLAQGCLERKRKEWLESIILAGTKSPERSAK